MKKAHNIILLTLASSIITSNAATIVAGDVTANLGPDLFFDSASTGGGTDFNSSNANFDRDFGSLTTGAGGSTITITGIGWASSATGTAATTATVTITYLGLDGAIGGGDDVLIGSVTDSLTFTGASEYFWSFDTALEETIDAANSIFRINVNSDANIRYKTFPSTSGAANVKLSAAGISAAAVPEPTVALLGSLGLFGLLRRRR